MPRKPQSFLARLAASMGCWLERQAAAQIEYLKAENRLIRARLGRRRILFTDPERRTRAAHAGEIRSTVLRDLYPLVSPATLMRWHRNLVAMKRVFLERRSSGRPRTKIDIEQLAVRMACETPSGVCARIHGAPLNLGIKIGRGTIRRLLKNHLIEPAPARDRRILWSAFLKAPWKAIAASDFFIILQFSPAINEQLPSGVDSILHSLAKSEKYLCWR